MAKKKSNKIIKKKSIVNKPLKNKKVSSDRKEKIIGTVASGVGAGIGVVIWRFLKKIIIAVACITVMIVLAKLLWSYSTGNPYPIGLGG